MAKKAKLMYVFFSGDMAQLNIFFSLFLEELKAGMQ